MTTSFRALGTFNTIHIPDCRDDTAVSAACTRVLELHHRFSAFEKESDIAKINIGAGKRFVQVHPDTMNILRQAVRFSELTGGAFDVTVRPLVSLWNIGAAVPSLPDRQSVHRALKLIGYKDIEFDEKRCSVRLRKPGQSIDLGGIAKGFAADEVRRILLEAGVREAVVNLGGTVIVIGPPKPVGVQHPNLATGSPLGYLDVSDNAVVTSGSYEKFSVIGGKRYHHLLSPFTGFPSESGILSITLIGESAMVLDALTTAIFIMGVKKSALLLSSASVDSVIVTTAHDVFVSGGIKDTFVSASIEVPQ